METTFRMPQMSMTMHEGVIIKWHKKEGEAVQKDEPLLEIETDKIVMSLTAPQTGIVKAILVSEGDSVPVGGDLCILSDERDAENSHS